MTASELSVSTQQTSGTDHIVLAPGSRLAVSVLSYHPGNVRGDLRLDEAFLASIAENGVLVPLRITPAPENAATDNDGAASDTENGPPHFIVIDGHRRLAAAIKADLAEVPVDLAPDRASDSAAQYLDMFTTNQHHLRLTPLEEADALFAASREGASKTKIRKTTAVSKDTLDNALKAGRLSAGTRTKTAACYEMNLEQYARCCRSSTATTPWSTRCWTRSTGASPVSTPPSGSAPNAL
jgi:hypothetical protein